MRYTGSVHGQRLVSLEPLRLPDRQPEADGQLCGVFHDDSLVAEASADRKLGLEDDRATEKESVDQNEIIEPDGWWGIRVDGDGSPRAGLTYNGFLFEIVLIPDDAQEPDLDDIADDIDRDLDAYIRYADDPEMPFNFPLGNNLERMIVPLWLMLAHNDMASVHAGAAIDPDNQIGWMWTGPSGAGKSSILAAMVEKRPFCPCADETAVLQANSHNDSVQIFPGAPWLRLYDEPGPPALNRRIDADDAYAASGELPESIDKRWYRFHDAVYPTHRAPLQHWFLLAPNSDVASPEVDTLSGGDLATSLLSETIDFNQRDDAWARRRFKNAMEIARRVPASIVRYDKSRQPPADIADALIDHIAH
jgi:hypothetical protein